MAAGYESLEAWRRYLPFVPERFRFHDDQAPREEWWSWRGATIHLDLYEVENPPATVLLLHGGGGYGRMLFPLAVALQRMGYRVVAPDLPGYGLSRVRRNQIDYRVWVDCASELLQEESKRTGKPVVPFGLSMGGYLGYLVAARTREAGALIATTLCDPRSPKVIDDFSVNAFVGRVMLPISRHTLRWASGLRLPIRWFSKMKAIANDEKLVEVICNDPLGGGARPPLGFLLSIFEVRPDLEPEDFGLCPVLFMHPTEDHWTSLDASKEFFDRLASKDKEFALLEGCGHFPLEEPGITQLEHQVQRFLDRLFRRH